MKKVFNLKDILSFVILVNVLILMKNIYIEGISNICYYYVENSREIIFQILLSIVFGVLISIKKNKKKK